MRLKGRSDTGFSAQSDLAGNRLLNRDGSSNIRKVGLRFIDRFHLYHALISMKLVTFLLTTLVIYLGINLLFAAGYVAIGVDSLVDSSIVKVDSQYLRAFFFSSQTLTTLGYGQMSPTGIGANILASIEAFVGLLLFALLTGLLYGRFSRPRAKLLYSDYALISPYKDLGKGLMLRFANPKKTSIINVSAAMLFSY
ncbi:MAG: two pore domain potassium channel family protein [Flavobacteriales bacterium]|nr:two pore domain potassium channel family protein [Flavobacteriales bacterium]